MGGRFERSLAAARDAPRLPAAATIRRTSFLAAESWHPPGWFLGTHGAALGDVDGDGRADVVWSTDYSVSVLRSTGSSFKPGEVWFSGGAFYANHGIFVADFDGNGRGDHVAIGDGYIGALRSQQSRSAGEWRRPSMGPPPWRGPSKHSASPSWQIDVRAAPLAAIAARGVLGSKSFRKRPQEKRS
jgi:hypothetical protein